MSVKLSGTIKKILPEEKGKGAKGEWIKQPFILTTKDQYPKDVYFEAFGKLSETVNQLRTGQEVTVHFNLESREYNNRYYTTARAWKVEQAGQSNSTNSEPDLSNEEDDLPF